MIGMIVLTAGWNWRGKPWEEWIALSGDGWYVEERVGGIVATDGRTVVAIDIEKLEKLKDFLKARVKNIEAMIEECREIEGHES